MFIKKRLTLIIYSATVKNVESVIVQGIQEIVNKSKHIVLVTHVYPDGDTLGSAFALRYYLHKKGINSSIICEERIPPFLRWMLYGEDIKNLIHHSFPDHIDAFILVDHNCYTRSEKTHISVEQHPAPKIIIDHHPETHFTNADYMICEVSVSSTCELIYRLIEHFNETHMIDKKIAACLYAGIITDTGNFAYGIKTASVFQIVSKLLETGIERNQIYEKIYYNFTLNRLKLLGFSLLKKLTVICRGKVAYIALNKNELKRFKYQTGDSEGIVNYALSITGVKISIFIVQRNNIVKISFRSKDNIPINKYARKYFSGGGHLNAAGAIDNGPLSETIKKIQKTLAVFINEYGI